MSYEDTRMNEHDYRIEYQRVCRLNLGLIQHNDRLKQQIEQLARLRPITHQYELPLS